MNIFFAYAFFFAGYAKWSGFKDFQGAPITTGTIMTVIFAIFFGAMGLNAIGPNL